MSKSTERKGTKKRKDLYQEVTDTIIKQIESGTKPWLKPWSSDKAIHSGPVNGVSGHKYKGINALILFCKHMKKVPAPKKQQKKPLGLPSANTFELKSDGVYKVPQYFKGIVC